MEFDTEDKFESIETKVMGSHSLNFHILSSIKLIVYQLFFSFSKAFGNATGTPVRHLLTQHGLRVSGRIICLLINVLLKIAGF